MSKKPVHWDDDPPPSEQNAAPQVEPAAAPKWVRVRCISHGRPFTHLKGLDFGEEADVTQDVAEALMARELVELV